MKNTILWSKRSDVIEKRFRTSLVLLSGRKDIADVCNDVELSPSAARNFLNTMVAHGYASKKFVKAGSLPVCFCPPWPNHNEYQLTKRGMRYISDQLAMCEEANGLDQALVQELKQLLSAKK